MSSYGRFPFLKERKWYASIPAQLPHPPCIAHTNFSDQPGVKAQSCFGFWIAESCEEFAVLYNAEVGQ